MNTVLLDGLTAEIISGILAAPQGRFVGLDTKAPIDLNDATFRHSVVATALGYAKEILNQTAGL